MKPKFFTSSRLLFATCLFLFTTFSMAQPTAREPDISRKINELLTRYGIPGAAALVYRDGKIDEYVFGYTDSSKQTPVSKNTLFELGSVTKTVTALLLAQQVGAGKLQLNDTWGQMMPEQTKMSHDVQAMRLLDLATYSASVPKDVVGLPYNALDSEQSRKKLNHFLATWKAPFVPRSRMVYSNLGYSLLGMALESEQAKPLFEQMQQGIFGPLHMKETTLNLNASDPSYARYSEGYTSDDKPARSPQDGLLPGSWALKSSLEDMRGYLKAAVGDADTPLTLHRAMQMTQTAYYDRIGAKNGAKIGLAWSIIPLSKLSKNDFNTPVGGKRAQITVKAIAAPRFDGNSLIDKTGSTDGFRAYIGVIPDQKTGIVILTNKFTYSYGALRDLGRSMLVDYAKSRS